MGKFPVDAPKSRVIKALEMLGFQILREREHVSMVRQNHDGTRTPMTLPNHQSLYSEDNLQSSGYQQRRVHAGLRQDIGNVRFTTAWWT